MRTKAIVLLAILLITPLALRAQIAHEPEQRFGRSSPGSKQHFKNMTFRQSKGSFLSTSLCFRMDIETMVGRTFENTTCFLNSSLPELNTEQK
jgi:hypothetical protein